MTSAGPDGSAEPGEAADEYQWLREQLQAAARLAEAGEEEQDWVDHTGGALSALLVRTQGGARLCP